MKLTTATATQEYARHHLAEITKYEEFRDKLIKYALTRDFEKRQAAGAVLISEFASPSVLSNNTAHRSSLSFLYSTGCGVLMM